MAGKTAFFDIYFCAFHTRIPLIIVTLLLTGPQKVAGSLMIIRTGESWHRTNSSCCAQSLPPGESPMKGVSPKVSMRCAARLIARNPGKERPESCIFFLSRRTTLRSRYGRQVFFFQDAPVVQFMSGDDVGQRPHRHFILVGRAAPLPGVAA